MLKSRDITLPKKVHIDKAIVFPVVMYSCESWNLKKAECQRIDAFKMWCWRTPESPLNSKEIKPVNRGEINPEYSLEGLMLKLQYFGHLMQINSGESDDSLEKTLMLGKNEGRGRRGRHRMR